MKRYSPNIESIKQFDGIKVYRVSFDEKPYGDWVKYEDVRKMLAMLREIDSRNRTCIICNGRYGHFKDCGFKKLIKEGGE